MTYTPAANIGWKLSTEFGRVCRKCGIQTKRWAKPKMQFCDGCTKRQADRIAARVIIS